MAIQTDRTGRVLATLAAYILLSTTSLVGETWTWDGGGLNNNWTTALNWDSGIGRDTAPDNDGTADIVMAGSTRLTPRVDVDWDINSLTFNSTAGGFSISGDPGVSLGIGAGGITNNDTQTQILLLPIDLNATQLWNAAAGPLSIGNTVAGHPLIRRTLTLDGANNIQIAGALTNDLSVNKAGTGTLIFNGLNTNTYTGTTTVSAGTLVLNRTGGPNRAIPGKLVIGDGAGGASADVVRLDAAEQITETAGRTVTINSSGLLNLNGFNETVANLAINGGAIGGAGTLNVNEALTFTGGGSINGTALGAAALPVVVNDGVLGISSGGRLFNGTGFIANTTSSTGTVTVTGAESAWTNTTELYVGHSGNATLDLSSGGDAISFNNTYVGYNSGSMGVANVSTVGGGNQTRFVQGAELFVGHDGTGSLNVSDGGYAQNTNGFIGQNASSDGRVTVSGEDSEWNNLGSLTVSKAGKGTLSVTAAGVVKNTTGTIGDDIGSIGEVTVEGVGSTWSNNGNLFVGNAGNGTLNIAAGGQITSVNGFIGDDAGSIGAATVDSANSSWTNTGDLYVGNAGNGTLNILGTGQVGARRTFVGNGVGSVGAVRVDGNQAEGSIWTTSQSLYVGKDGIGSLNIVDGGNVESGTPGLAGEYTYIGYGPGSQGAVVVDGALTGMFGDPVYRSTLQTGVVYVGHEGTGSLDVTGGAEVFLNGTVHINYGSSNTSTARVIGSGSSWFSGSLQVGLGHGGLGLFEVRDGGEAFSGPALVGLNIGFSGQPTSTFDGLVIVQGSGSKWRVGGGALVPGSLVLGYHGASVGELRVSEGGHVTTEFGQLGLEAGAIGIATLTGSGSTWTNSMDLYVGVMGDASLSIAEGARLETADAYIGFGVDSTGYVSIDGADSSWTNSGNLHVGAAGSGTLALSNGGFVVTTDLIVGALGEISGEGIIVGNIENQGLVSPGTSPGELNIDGDYLQTSAGELLIELSSPSAYDQLLITGSTPLRTGVATLTGTLTVDLLDDFLPSDGQSFTILTADFVTGTFSTLAFPTVPNLAFDVAYNPQSVVLTVSAVGVPGDYNGDGKVDAADYVVWRKNDGTQQGYDRWRTNFGRTAASGSGATAGVPSSAAVPELSTLMLVYLALAAALPLRHRLFEHFD